MTAKEHFIAHYLLWKDFRKRYGSEHWKTKKMAYAFHKMTVFAKNQKRYFSSNSFSLIREWYSLNNPMKNIEIRNKISGKNAVHYGKTGILSHVYGDKNPMKREENKDKVRGNNNPNKRLEVRKKHWKAVERIDILTR